ncbi:hypothetical protein CEUSTIGMA_g2154.t1 [Chlamydomonas eustigma]|uniref:Amine oxidase n=1 Tax=Chlamydomonas eustigma TaxID=1157962 RepID=A0A250WVC1_9CHLO|nr:hypothetical protein CEUSTIGMA_g2154.t1 [Chlamydomonas eustigma]|eukprot:GAX74706.1 hypothetical protein CEUSTIGMA_g2154.t1 [Chlamydomonas eustigma]
MTAMLSFRVLFFLATICITSLGVLHEAASSQSAYYAQIRLQDKNIDSVHSAALKAAGLGPGAGTYLTAEDIALISGWSDESLKPLHRHIVDLGGEVVTHSIFRDTVVVSFSKKAFQSLTLSLDLGKLPSDLLSSNEKVEQVLAEIIYGNLPSHIISHVHFVNSLSTVSPFQAELSSPNLGDQAPLFARDTTSYLPARPYVNPSSAELFAAYSQQRAEKYDSGLQLTAGRLSLVLPAPYPGYTLQLFRPDYLGFWIGWKSASSMRITSVGMPI